MKPLALAYEAYLDKTLSCPWCGSKRITRHGIIRPEYYCNACGYEMKMFELNEKFGVKLDGKK